MPKRLVLIACFLTVFVAYAIRYGYGILLPEMLDSLHITKTDAGVIYSAFLIAYTVFSPVCGFISDRFGSRWLISSLVVIMGIGTCLMSAASSILQASLYFALAGIGAAACWAPVVALAQKWSSHTSRGKTLSYIDIGSALGFVAMGAFIPFIIRNYDWRAGWLILGIVTVACGVFNFTVMKNPPSETISVNAPGPASPKHKLDFAALFLNSRFWLFGVSYLFVGVAVMAPITFLNTYVVQELDYPFIIGANVMIVLGIGAIVSKLIIGPLSDKSGRLIMMYLCGFLMCLGILLMMIPNIITVFVATFIFSLGYGVVWALYAAAASDYFDKASSGTIVGIWTVFLGIGLALAPILSGWLADRTGTFNWTFLLGGAGGILSSVLLLPLWKTARK
jgi:sugar phosphate permease